MIPLGSIVELGLIYGIVAIGVYLSFRIMQFPDLSVDGTFPLGAAVVAVLLSAGMNPSMATLLAMISGMLAGLMTGILCVSARIMNLLAGILVMTALYSINIRIMGKPNMAIMDIDTIFTGGLPAWILLSIVTISIVLFLRLFFTTQYGLALRAVGNNAIVSQAYGVSIRQSVCVMLAVSNGLVALAGALFAQLQGFADVAMGTGTIVIGLASIMIGEAIFKTRSLMWQMIGCVLGSILYRFAVAIALNGQVIGLQASDLNLVTTVLVVVAMMLPRMRRSL